jgi:alpha-tubulin suppressor-like RCC1 family protein
MPGSAAAGIDSPTLLPGLPAVAEVIGGEFHGLALARDGRVFAWGSNAEFALDGTTRGDSSAPIESGFRP